MKIMVDTRWKSLSLTVVFDCVFNHDDFTNFIAVHASELHFPTFPLLSVTQDVILSLYERGTSHLHVQITMISFHSLSFRVCVCVCTNVICLIISLSPNFWHSFAHTHTHVYTETERGNHWNLSFWICHSNDFFLENRIFFYQISCFSSFQQQWRRRRDTCVFLCVYYK